MAKFSKLSQEKLNTCHRDLITIFNEVIKYFDCTIVYGHRSVEKQQELYAQGRTQEGPIVTYCDGVNKKSKHNHNPSKAVDVIPYFGTEENPIQWNNIKSMYYFGGFVMGIARRLKDEGKITHEIRYGGDWDQDGNVIDESFVDAVHFEII